MYGRTGRYFNTSGPAYYCKSLSLKESIYLVFTPDSVEFDRLNIKEGREAIEGIMIITYLIVYNIEKDF